MTILCGTDFSESSAHAVRAAAAIAFRFREAVSLVHVVEADSSTGGDAGRRASLEDASARIRGRGVEVSAEIREGVPDEALVEHAVRAGASLIVLAALGRRSAPRWLLGSVADRVAQTSPVPVIVVRDAAPFDEWARGSRSLRILVGLDPSTESDAILAWVRGWSRAGTCDLTAGHVVWPVHASAGGAPPGECTGGPALPSAEELLRPALARRWKEGLGIDEARILIRTNFGRSADPLAEMAVAEGADLLVVGNHQRSGMGRLWHGSVSRDVLHVFAGNVACVPWQGSHVASATVKSVNLRRILCPTDLSEISNRAIPYALALLGRGGVVHLLHVQDEGTSLPQGHEHPEAALRRLVPEDVAARGINVHVEVMSCRRAAGAIAEAAERMAADAICMSSHGRSGVVGWLAGSVAREVLQTSSRPVLLLRP